MAKLTGPLMSIDARGSIAGALTFSAWKGRNYVRQLVTPANPKSPAQTAFRAMFGFLSRRWAGLDSIEAGSQAAWQALAEAGNYSPFNAYMRYNQDAWSRYQGPVIAPEATGGTPGVSDTFSATAGVKSVLIAGGFADYSTSWGAILYRNAGSAPTGLQTQIIAILPITIGEYEYQDNGLTPGVTYYYEQRAIDENGLLGTLSADQSATPT